MPNFLTRPFRGLLLTLLAVCALPVRGLLAGDDAVSADSKDKNTTQSVLDEITPLNELNTEASYVGQSSFEEKRFDGRGPASSEQPYRSQSESQESFEYAYRIHLTGRVYLKLGADYERFDFNTGTAPIPSGLQNIAGVVAVEYVVQGQAAAFISSKPGVYYSDFDNIKVGAFDAPTNIGLIIPASKKLFFLAGVHVSLLSKYPVFPFGGVVWFIKDNLTLKAVPLEPRLIYSVNKQVDLFAGGELLGEAYKTEGSADARKPDRRFNDAVLDFSEVRGGLGVSYKPAKGVSLDFSGGWDVGRDFDYYRGDSTKRLLTHGAPYGKFELVASF